MLVTVHTIKRAHHRIGLVTDDGRAVIYGRKFTNKKERDTASQDLLKALQKGHEPRLDDVQRWMPVKDADGFVNSQTAEHDVVVASTGCVKCGGDGHYGDHGSCYACQGKGVVTQLDEERNARYAAAHPA